jgi:membrane protease subunit HflC
MTRLISILVALVLAVMLLSSTMFVVGQHRYAVVYALGELREVIREPGLHFKLPPPFQNVVYLDKRLQTLNTPSDDRFLTQDKKDLLVDTFVKWKIADPHQYLIAVGGDAGRGGERIAQVVHTALSLELGRRAVQDVVSGQREQIGDAVRARVAEASRRLGVDVLDLRLKRVDYVDPVTASVLERMKAERLREASDLRASGVTEAEQIRTDAELQRTTILADAQRQAQTIQGEGDAKATQIYAQSFGKNPEFYRFYRSMEAYRATFKNRSDVLVLDSNSEFFKYFKNPGAGK